MGSPMPMNTTLRNRACGDVICAVSPLATPLAIACRRSSRATCTALRDNFTGREMSRVSHLPRGTKHAAHRTANL